MRTLVLILCLAVFFSCKDKGKQAEASSQMEEVMMIHDEVMPKMGKLSKLVSELKSKVDTTAEGRKYEQAMKELQDSHKSMMQWMQGFGDRFDSDEILNGKSLSAQKKEWLNEEEEKVRALKDKINSSIEKAETLLKN